jgi:hypothetical protein
MVPRTDRSKDDSHSAPWTPLPLPMDALARQSLVPNPPLAHGAGPGVEELQQSAACRLRPSPQVVG